MISLLIWLICIEMDSEVKHVEKNGVKFNWWFEDSRLCCSVSAPTSGWIAVGFNSRSGLVGTNLIMGASEFEHFEMSDRYIIKPGEHCSVLSLGVVEALSNRSVQEMNGQTIMQFDIFRKTEDHFHHDLSPGKKIYLLLAYSVSDDFHHHSRMRTEIVITL